YSDEDVDEIYNVRVLLDMQVYERIVKQRLMTDAHYDYLKRCIDKYGEMRSVFEKSLEEGQLEFFDLECRFHFYIHNISGLKWTTELLKKTYSRLFQYMIHNVEPEYLPRIYTFHLNIVENLKAGDLAALAENRIESYMEGKAYRPDE
ncbi:MAG: GntR family transcriptional regulator, partial [Pyramidobacter sp.]|nr:GntR family transcriptional regulator [Pyramidobacter sp.]